MIILWEVVAGCAKGNPNNSSTQSLWKTFKMAMNSNSSRTNNKYAPNARAQVPKTATRTSVTNAREKA